MKYTICNKTRFLFRVIPAKAGISWLTEDGCVNVKSAENIMQQNQGKTGMIIMASAGVLALVFGFWQMRNNIRKPFLLRPVEKSGELVNTGIDEHNKDTDKDGLSDFDELYIYSTSPYLEDTDSDAKTDSAEITAGTDPNCPEGKECGAVESSSNATQLQFPAISASPIYDEGALNPEMLTNMTPDQVRDMLKAGGISDDDLSKLDDRAIMEIYQSALAESE